MGSNTDKKRDEVTILIEGIGAKEDPSCHNTDVDNDRLDTSTINRIVTKLAEKCPPGSDMHEWIKGFEFLGARPKRHIITRIYLLITVEMPEVTLKKIENSIFYIISAFKKETLDATHIIS